MALYYEAATFLTPGGLASSESLSSRVHSSKGLRSPASQLYALLVESARWSAVLSQVIEIAGILKHEKKLTPALALLLVHDLLLSRRGVAAPKDHVLALCVTRHRARLSAEFTKARIKAGYASIQAWQEELRSKDGAFDLGARHPRWVRINTLCTSLDDQSKSGSLSNWYRKSQIPRSAPEDYRAYYNDEHVDDLVATAAGTELTRTKAYRAGEIILQDKASCFSAFLLQPSRHDGDIIDGCAAPGNKTTHLAALFQKASPAHKNFIFAIERNAERSATLQKMVKIAHADRYGVKVLANQDFSRLDPTDPRFQHVTAILLDPSCSGSGIVGRDQGDDLELFECKLPRTPKEMGLLSDDQSTRPRKKPKINATTQSCSQDATSEAGPPQVQKSAQVLEDRLRNLSAFQLSLILHAFKFPKARKLVYSTCSIHAMENEHVVCEALTSDVAKRRGWKILRREDQIKGLRDWPHRGLLEAFEQVGSPTVSDLEAHDLAEACIRCHKGTDDGTMGFFVVAFYRDMEVPRDYWCGTAIGASTNVSMPSREAAEEEEWEGFSDA